MVNRLGESTSPYLRQHADNPVDWWEWGPEAFAEATTRDVPVLLSVGYSSCHWCHVMAHESFEDDETAELMNANYVNIKVDREERPDVDAVYMDAVQAMTGQGGWPMTVWLAPDGKPFHAGTYFPKHDRGGMPAFGRVLTAVSEAWGRDRQPLLDQAGRLTAAIDREIPGGEPLNEKTLRAAYEAIAGQADPIHGGFGGAPKFPQVPVLEFLLRVADQPWAPQARPIVRQSLIKMARGGIYDHVIGGFARYSVDETWLVPHFEKMLYDNAQLARIYLRAGQVFEDTGFWTITREVIGYLNSRLRHPDGGYFSAEDADSEGEEGRFALFTSEQFTEATGSDAAAARLVFGVSDDGNFEGNNVLWRERSHAEVAEALGMTVTEVDGAIGRAINGLRKARAGRVQPGLDDKVVTSWNGLAIRALAEAGAVLDSEEYLDDARRCARFILSNLVTPEGRLLRSWSHGRATTPGFLDDHASMAVGLFALYQATGEVEWYHSADQLVREMLTLFDSADGALYSTGLDAEKLIVRKKDQMDNPLPSGNSLAVEALLQLGSYTGDSGLFEKAEAITRGGSLLADRYPSAVGHLLAVGATQHAGLRELAVTGPGADELSRVAWESFRPGVVLATDPAGAGGLPLLEDRHVEGATLAYLCENFVCQRPVSTITELRGLLDSPD